VPLVFVTVLPIAETGLPDLLRRGRPPRRPLRRRRRSGVRPGTVVEFARSHASSRRSQHGKRGTPSLGPLCAGEQSPGAAEAAPLPTGRRLLGSCECPGPPDRDPTDRVSVDPSLRRQTRAAAPACHLSRWILIRRIRSVRLGSNPPPPVNPRFD
jgi:hypothetical protein